MNPAVDYVMKTEEVSLGRTNRSRMEEMWFGGKGINVSLVLRELGMESVVLGYVAGFTGEALEEYLHACGIRSDMIRLSRGMTRINVKLKTDRETEINASGPEVSPREIEALMDQLERLHTGDTLVLSGSVPRGVPPDMYARIMARLAGREIRIAVDAEGELLRRTLPYRPFLIKPNRAELSDLVGQPMSDDEDVVAAARALQAQGARHILVSLGREGAILLDELGQVYRSPTAGADIPPVNTVGAGDSMVAGFLCGVAQGSDYALRLGIAAGSATACAVGLAKRETVLQLMEELSERKQRGDIR